MIKRASIRLLAVLLALALAAACTSDGGSTGELNLADALGGGNTDDPTQPVAAVDAAVIDEPGEWTVFVYLAADNDLEPFALEDLSEMGESTGVDLVVLIDRHGGYTSAPAGDLGDFEDTRLLHIRDGVVDVIDEPGELDMGDPAVLADFVADGLTEYGSERNGLVIWNHGASWPGAAVDETSGGTMLDMVGIRDAVSDGLERAGVEKFDLIGFDACLMATYEVAANLAPVARTLLASEELEPGHGWNWTSVSAPGGTASIRDLASAVADGFLAQSVDQRTSGITLSLVDLARLPAIEAAFGELAATVNADAAGTVGRLGSRRGRSISFGRHPDPRFDSYMVDLGHLGDLLSGLDDLGGPGAALAAAVDEAVLINVTDQAMAASTGLAVYFPPVHNLGRAGYEQVELVEPWKDFLRSYYTGAESIPFEALPTFLDDDGVLEDEDVVYDDAHLGIATDVVAGTGVNISTAKLFWGQVDLDSDLVVFYGESVAEIDGDTLRGSYDWRYLVINDGTDEVPAYSQLFRNAAGQIERIVVPVTYRRGSERVDAALVLGLEGEQVVTETFFIYSSSGSVAEIHGQPGDVFVPRMLVQDFADFSTSWVEVSEVPLYADPDLLDYRMRRLAPGTAVIVELMLTDIDGGRQFVFHGTASP